ncbi:MAG: BtrH N-terminal domain-containing protein [Candidatus Freyarchaeota archaeon]
MKTTRESRNDSKVGKTGGFVGSDRIILKGFRHLPGDHCVTCSLRKVFLYNGFDLSEDMLLGLGSGLGLVYWAMKYSVPFIGGRGNAKFYEFEKTVCDRLGIGVKLYRTLSTKKAAFLGYLCLPEEAHFGGHVVVVYGIDEVNDTVFVSDRLMKPSLATVREFVEARGSKHPPFAPRNKMLSFEFPRRLRDLREVLPEAIRQNMADFLNPPIKNLGVKAFNLIPRRLREWPKIYGDSELLMAMFNTYIYIEKGGTGGGLFRRMYSRFLLEASEILDLPDLEAASTLFLPDELPNVRRIREIFDEKERTVMESREGYMEKAKLLDDELSEAVKKAVPEAPGFTEFIPEIVNIIAEYGEIEKKAFKELYEVLKI